MRRETRRLQAENPSTIAGEAYILCPDVEPPQDPVLRPQAEGVGQRVEHAQRERQPVPAHPRPHHADRHRRARPGGLLLHRRPHPDDREGRLQAVAAMSVFARIRRWTAARRRLRAEHPVSRKQRGVAMLIVLTWLALMISRHRRVHLRHQRRRRPGRQRARRAARALPGALVGEPVAPAHQDSAAVHRPGDGAGAEDADQRDGVEHDERRPAAPAARARRRTPRLLACA